jgi:hypothetical protein
MESPGMGNRVRTQFCVFLRIPQGRKNPWIMKTTILDTLLFFNENLRNPINHAHSLRGWFVTALLVACFALSPQTQALSPQPDGGYPNGNTAEGDGALAGLTSGFYNSAVGFLSLLSNADASFNTGLGAGTLLVNTANENTAVGAGALLSNTIGDENTASGAFALFNNTEGVGNTAIGARALLVNTANENTAVGAGALLSNTTGGTVGNTDGFDVGPNVAVGAEALESNTIASANTAVGYQALRNVTTGREGTDLSASTGVGFQALAHATGDSAGNCAFGYQALVGTTTGISNTAIGIEALKNNTEGNFNVAIGAGAAFNVTDADNVICIGASGENIDNSCYIGGISGAGAVGGDPVFILPNGKLGTFNPLSKSPSSKRFKEGIKPMDKASEALFLLKPVAFRYNKEIDPSGTPQCGLVAEDVEKVNPDLIVRDKEGKPYGVRYDQVNAMLLNEFLKEHKKVEELQVTVAQQQKGMKILAAQLREQAAQIQKASAQLKVSKATTQMVVNSSGDSLKR